MTPRISVTVASLCLAAVTTVTGSGAPARGRPGAPQDPARPAEGTRERLYSLAARVRPLLFWIGKDDVGEGRIAWLAGPNGERGFELLIGSLPDRAPRRINRWGYIREVEEKAGVRIFGLMTEVDEATYEQAKASSGGVPEGARVFKVIQGRTGGGSAGSVVSGVALPSQLTLRDLDVVAARVPPPAEGPSIPVPPGTEPGFLFAMASLIRENVEVFLRTGAPPAASSRSYVYSNRLYEVVTRSSRFLERKKARGREFARVIESEFEARAAGKGGGGKYRIVYGTEGALREVPVRIVYRPNWWFEADLVLLDEQATGATSRREHAGRRQQPEH